MRQPAEGLCNGCQVPSIFPVYGQLGHGGLTICPAKTRKLPLIAASFDHGSCAPLLPRPRLKHARSDTYQVLRSIVSRQHLYFEESVPAFSMGNGAEFVNRFYQSTESVSGQLAPMAPVLQARQARCDGIDLARSRRQCKH